MRASIVGTFYRHIKYKETEKYRAANELRLKDFCVKMNVLQCLFMLTAS